MRAGKLVLIYAGLLVLLAIGATIASGIHNGHMSRWPVLPDRPRSCFSASLNSAHTRRWCASSR